VGGGWQRERASDCDEGEEAEHALRWAAGPRLCQPGLVVA